MRVSREKAAQNRAAIVEAAARLFRERGFDGVGVAEITQAAGLTHGGFYGHFASKDALAAEASAEALRKSRHLTDLPQPEPKDLRRFFRHYLSTAHRDAPGAGCALAALASEVPRQDPAVRQCFAAGAETLAAALSAGMPGADDKERRRRGLLALSAITGSLALARAAADSDPAFSAELLSAVKAELEALLDERSGS